MAFHKKLGSYRDKAERIEKLASSIASDVLARPDIAAQAAIAARLAKADLTTDMVYEFPELQGTMGGIYAREEGQPEAVWKAIYFHYLPIGVEADAAPARAQLGRRRRSWAAVSLADKLDTVVGLTNAGEKATGSRDPFGLRRQMHGIVRILMDLPELAGVDRELPVRPLLEAAARGYGGGDTAAVEACWLSRRSACATPSSSATADRRRPWRDQRLGRPRAAAGAAHRGGAAEDADVRGLPGAGDALQARQEHRPGAGGPRPARPVGADGAAEVALLAALDAHEPRVRAAIAAADYRQAVTEIAALRPAVDWFFNDVFVMAEDARLRTARLTLMADLRDLILELADISEIVPQTE